MRRFFLTSDTIDILFLVFFFFLFLYEKILQYY